MRLMCVFLAIATLTACGVDQTERHATTTKATGTTAAPTTTTTRAVETTTTSAHTSEDPGGESIGVTDIVTIVIVDPEDE